MALQRTLVMLKPQGMDNFNTVVKMIDLTAEHNHFDRDLSHAIEFSYEDALDFYSVHQGEWFHEPMAVQISSRLLEVFIFSGENAIDIMRRLRGETDPVEAYVKSPGSICGLFGIGNMKELAKVGQVVDTAAHASSSEAEAAREIAVVKRVLRL